MLNSGYIHEYQALLNTNLLTFQIIQIDHSAARVIDIETSMIFLPNNGNGIRKKCKSMCLHAFRYFEILHFHSVRVSAVCIFKECIYINVFMITM